MPFLGVSPTQEFTSVAKQTITGDGSTSYTLNKGVSTENDLAVFVNDVRQEPGVAYTASANTITFTANLESTDSCYVLHIGRSFSSASSPGIDDDASTPKIQITTDGHVLPTANVAYDLGSSDMRFRDLYLSGTSLHLGAHDITANATHVSMGNVATTGVMSGNAALMTSLNADELTSGTLPLARLPDDVTIVNNLTIGGDFVVNGNTTTIAANELKVEDSLIQLATNNEISDTIDIGFVGHYSNDGNTALHTGFFRDASNEYYYLFNGYEDAAFDTATPPSTIDRTANTFTLANFVANNVGMGSDPFLSNNYSTLNIRSTTGGQLLMGRDSGTNDWDFFAYSASTHTAIGTSANTYLTFHTDSTGVSNERMRIDSSGDVGVGTDSPTYKLVVSNGGAEGLEIDPVNVDGTIRVFAYDRANTSYIAAHWFADSHSWTAGGSSTWMQLDSNGDLNLNGNLHAGRGNDVSMSASADGMIQIDGNAYTGAITMDATAMYLYHNSATRNLVLATNETAQLTLDYNGNVQLNRGSLLVHDSNGSIDNALRLAYNGTSGQGDINVRSTGGDTYLRILTSNAGTTGEVARFTHDGNVGIGNTTPSYSLTVSETNTTASNRYTPVDVLEVQAHYEGGDGQPYGGAGVASFGSGLVFSNEKYSSSAITKSAAIYGLVSENSVDATGGGQLAFYTASTLDASLTEKMRILPNGDVGIGNADPTGDSAGTNYRHLDIQSSSTTVGGSIRLTDSADSSVFRIFNSPSIGTRLGTYSVNGLDIYTDSTFRVRFDHLGNVGINDTSPDAKLTIKDAAAASTDPTDPTHATISLQYTSTKLLNIGDYSATPYASYIQSVNTSGTGFVLALNPTGGSVGIGTNNPVGTLHVSSGTSGNCAIIIEADSDNDNEADSPQILFMADGGIREAGLLQNDNYLDIVSNVSSSGGVRFFTGSTNNYTNNIKNGATERMSINSTGDVTIAGVLKANSGVQVPYQSSTKKPMIVLQNATNYGLFHVESTNDDFTFDFAGVSKFTFNQTGNLTIAGTFTESSAMRYKENVQDLEYNNIISQLKPKIYNKIGQEEQEVGLIAEDVEALDKTLVTYQEDGTVEGIKYTRLVPHLIAHIQKLEERLTALENG